MNIESANKPEELPRGFLFPVWGRFLLTLVGVPGLLFALYFIVPGARSLPAYCTFATIAIVLTWWRDTNPEPEERHALRFIVAGAYGAGNFVMGFVSAVWSLIHASGFQVWVMDNISSGRLSFFVSAMLFGFNLAKAGYTQKVSTAAIWQNCIFALALLNLGYGYSLDQPVPYLGLLSWSIFFIIGDWTLIEYYVIDRKQMLGLFDYLRIIVVNLIVLFSWAVVMVNLWPSVHWIIYWVGIVNLVLIALVLWTCSAGVLAEFLEPKKADAAITGEDKRGEQKGTPWTP